MILTAAVLVRLGERENVGLVAAAVFPRVMGLPESRVLVVTYQGQCCGFITVPPAVTGYTNRRRRAAPQGKGELWPSPSDCCREGIDCSAAVMINKSKDASQPI